MKIATGAHFNHYRILDRLGEGGMGEVWLAQDTSLDRRVAIKVLHRDYTTDQERVLRFEQEARAASALNHPNIITIHEIGQVDETHFIATEHIEGETLRQRMKAMDLSAALDAAMQITGALVAAHAAGIIHRDLKPDNVMVRPDGLVKVLDFGLARVTERRRKSEVGSRNEDAATLMKGEPVNPQSAISNPQLTMPGTVMGTPHYMSPEQARGLEVDARTDIFSLGVVLYEMITGHKPFDGQTPIDVTLAIVDREPLPPSHHLPDLPRELDHILDKALRKDCDRRYQTARGLLTDLEDLRQDLEFEARLARSGDVSAARGDATDDSIAVQTAETARASAAETVPAVSSAEYLLTGLQRHRIPALAAFMSLLLALAAVVYFYPWRGGVKTSGSIAVLPLKNLSGDPDQEYFAEGMTEALITDLTRVAALRVISRTSVMQYQGVSRPLPEIARELDVEMILDGSVIQVEDRVRISAQLVNAREDVHIWAENYEYDMKDVLALQSRVARRIVDEIEVQLTPQEQARLTRTQRVTPEAYRLYLKGRYFWNRRTQSALRQSLEYFQQAIDKDPAYAMAWAGLADSYAILGSEGYDAMPPREAMSKAKAAALRALGLDERLGEAHATLAFVGQRERDWAGAEREFRRAIELNPSYASAHQWFYSLLWQLGRAEEAGQEIRRAQDLDPLSLIINTNLGVHAYFLRDYDRAIAELRKVLEMEPDFWVPYVWIGLIEAEKGNYREAIEAAEKAVALTDRIRVSVAILGHIYGRADEMTRAREILAELKQRSQQEYVSPFIMAWICTGMGDRDEAFAWLERAVERQDPYLAFFFKPNPSFDNLRQDARYAALLARMNLPL